MRLGIRCFPARRRFWPSLFTASSTPKTRSVLLGYAQRAAAHYASATDAAEAAACGEAAVRAAVEGKSGFMVKLVRQPGRGYACVTGLHPLSDIANVEHLLPRDWMSADGFMRTKSLLTTPGP